MVAMEVTNPWAAPDYIQLDGQLKPQVPTLADFIANQQWNLAAQVEMLLGSREGSVLAAIPAVFWNLKSESLLSGKQSYSCISPVTFKGLLFFLSPTF